MSSRNTGTNVTQPATSASGFPRIRTVGVDGMLVSFADTLTEPANRAALAFRTAVAEQGWDGIEELSSSLVSAFLRFDPLQLSHEQLQRWLTDLVGRQDWYAAALPSGRRLWRIPTVFGTDLAPQLGTAAAAAGMTEAEAIASLASARVRVQTIGFAPGQPYLGALDAMWDIPRQTQLSKQIPKGALAVAIRQLVLFSVPTPTGWQHVGQTAVDLFRPDADTPFLLQPGDEVEFPQITPAELEALRSDPMGGATCVSIA